ncbi:MAG: hypothetical protein KatS3mg108_0059 [Isosphaeraceae bacterium]|nr:MAG: hypothetical protein KatS3mg108_0059 [Isosphaeraceae bacterium]
MADAKRIRAGAAYVELAVKDSRLVKGLDAAAKKLKAFGASVAGLGARLVALGGAALAPVAGMISHFKDAGDAFLDMAERTGVSTEALSELGFAAEQSGADLETLEVGLKAMQRNIVSAADGSREMRATLAKLGLTVADLKALTPDEQFRLLADRIAQVGNPTQRAALAMDVFGKSGQKLIPLLSAGAKGIDELRAEANRLGLTVGTDQAQSAADLQDAWNRLLKTLKAAAFAIGGALAPDLTALLGTITRFVVGVVNWVKENKAVIVTVAKVIAAVVGVGVALIAAGGAISFVGAAIGGLVSLIMGVVAVFKILAAVVAAILSPIGLVTAAVVALAGYLIYTSDAGSQALGWLGEQFNGLKDTALAAWQGISDALAAGDIGLAARILWLTLKMEFQKGVLWLEEKWIDFKNFFIDTFYRAVYGLARFLNDAWAGIQVAWVETVSFLGTAWTNFIGVLQKGWNRFSGFFKKVWARVKSVFTGKDAGEEIARINDEIAAEDNAINARRDAAVNERETERQRRRAAIEGERAGVEDELNRMQEAERAEREKRKQETLAAGEADIAAARKEWEDALAEAKRKREEAEARVPERMKRPDIPELDEVADTAREKVDIQGTFSALAVRGLGAESLSERTAKAAEQTAANTKKLVQEAQHGGLVFA